jgi:mannosyltransferase
LGVAAATLIMMMWGLGRPALWLDESASVIATQRSWAGLWVLFGGTDAPLVPYYALLRTASSAVTSIAPDSAASPELLFRWPSVAVTVLGAWALTLWLARRCPPELAISTAALLLATGSFSRYAQEARPYAFVLAAAVACTILWTRLIRDESRRWVVLHALAVASLVAAHLLAASLVFLTWWLPPSPRPKRTGDRWCCGRQWRRPWVCCWYRRSQLRLLSMVRARA